MNKSRAENESQKWSLQEIEKKHQKTKAIFSVNTFLKCLTALA